MGYVLGKNCEQLAEDNSMLCVVDMLVLPLFRIVYATEQGNFPENYNQFRDRLTELRKTCQQAFMDDLKGENGQLEYFIKIYEYLSQPYTWTDSQRRELVAEYANSLTRSEGLIIFRSTCNTLSAQPFWHNALHKQSASLMFRLLQALSITPAVARMLCFLDRRCISLTTGFLST